MPSIAEVIDFLMNLMRDDTAQRDFARDPDTALASRGLADLSAQDVRDARLMMADSGAVQPRADRSGQGGSGTDPIREIHHTTTNFTVGSVTTTVISVQDNDTLILDSFNNDVTAIQDNDTTDIDVISITDEDEGEKEQGGEEQGGEQEEGPEGKEDEPGAGLAGELPDGAGAAGKAPNGAGLTGGPPDGAGLAGQVPDGAELAARPDGAGLAGGLRDGAGLAGKMPGDAELIGDPDGAGLAGELPDSSGFGTEAGIPEAGPGVSEEPLAGGGADPGAVVGAAPGEGDLPDGGDGLASVDGFEADDLDSGAGEGFASGEDSGFGVQDGLGTEAGLTSADEFDELAG
jgi:hypothetical protein